MIDEAIPVPEEYTALSIIGSIITLVVCCGIGCFMYRRFCGGNNRKHQRADAKAHDPMSAGPTTTPQSSYQIPIDARVSEVKFQQDNKQKVLNLRVSNFLQSSQQKDNASHV